MHAGRYRNTRNSDNSAESARSAAYPRPVKQWTVFRLSICCWGVLGSLRSTAAGS
jgi:hypothetical protein